MGKLKCCEGATSATDWTVTLTWCHVGRGLFRNEPSLLGAEYGKVSVSYRLQSQPENGGRSDDSDLGQICAPVYQWR